MNKVSVVFKKIRYRLSKQVWKFLCLLRGDRIATFTLIEGSTIKYPFNTAIGRLLFGNNFEPEELKFLMASLHPGDTCFDVGANGGIFTVIAAKQVGPIGHVYAFEPGLRELALLKENVALNQLNNVTIVASAVSDRTGETQFALSQDGAMNSMFSTDHPEQKIESWTTVKTTTLDDFVASQQIKEVNFLKIDVEGAEQLVFEGSQALLAQPSALVIMFESADVNASAAGNSTQDILKRLSAAGFQLDAIEHYGGVKPIKADLSNLSNLTTYNFVATKVTAEPLP
ncbi:MAG: FkbM family methyltransferase [Cyanobacteria bacterium J06634_5]